jgi:HEAT repeat protein
VTVLVAALALWTVLPQQVYSPADFNRPSGATLQSRFDNALAEGRRNGTDTFWIAYELPARTNVHVNSRDGIETFDRSEPQRTGLFFLAKKSDGAIDKLRVVNLSEEVRVHDRKVYWIGEPTTDESARLLLQIARSANPMQLKKDAIFWLGQEISSQAGEDLKTLAANDPEVEVQKQAVFALSLRTNDESIPALERVAKEHSNAAVRKQAIFWLGQKRDPRVLDFFEQLLKKN